jgi:HK97 gp10 family phage protein
MDNIKIDTKKLDELIAKSPEMVDKAIRSTTFDVEGNAKSAAAVDTGAMKASIFTKTSKGSNMPSSVPGDAELNDPTPDTPPLMTAYVAPGVNYAAYVEFGTSKMAAQPFMTPAVEKADAAFIRYMQQIFGDGNW